MPAARATSSTPCTIQRTAGRRRPPCFGGPRSAGDIEVVADLQDAGGHPGGADHRVVLGPGADVPAQGHRVAAGVDVDVAVVLDDRVAVQRVLHEPGDVDRIGVAGDLDVVLDVADAGQPGDRQFGRLALPAELDQAGQGQLAIPRGGLHAVRVGDVQRQRVVGRGGQPCVVAVVAVRQRDGQVVEYVLHAGDALRGGGGLQVLRVARYGAVQRHLAVHVPDGDVRRV